MENKISTNMTWGRVRDLSQDGEGIVAIQSPDPDLSGRVVFIQGLVPGDVIEVNALHREGKKVLVDQWRLLESSEDRQAPFCPHFGECGGCQLQEMTYEATLRWKTKRVLDTLARVAKLPREDVAKVLKPCLSPAEPFGFRSVVQLRPDANGRLGFFRRGSHDVLAQDVCPIQSDLFNQIRDFLNALFKEIDPTGSSKLDHVELRQNVDGSRFMILLVFSETIFFKGLLEFDERLLRHLDKHYGPDAYSLYLEAPGDLRHRCGPEKLISREDGLEIRYSVHAFQQTNRLGNAILCREVEKLAEQVAEERLSGALRILELYAGVGNITLHLAGALPEARFFLVENNSEAILDAWENAKINGLTEDRVQFRYKDAARFFRRFREENNTTDVDLLIVDPPRQGLDRALCQDIADSGIPHMIYVSCDPASLARDLNILKSAYRPVHIQPIDMFPWTTHVETVVLMSRKG